MFRSPRFIICSAAAFYVVALAVAWQQADARAQHRTDTILQSAEKGYADIIDGEIDAALRYVGGAVVNLFGGKPQAASLERMKELARTFNIDEINIVNSRGIAIASNISSVKGFDFNTNVHTRAFMALTNGVTTLVAQPFRRGVANPEMLCRYYGMAFPARDGFLQFGVTVDRLRQNMYAYSEAEADRILKDWHFSVVGWYERAEKDPEFKSGRTVRRRNPETGERVVGRFFDYVGYPYVAYIPESYCYSQRNSAFVVTALVLGVLLFAFVFILVRLASASAKLEALHAAADARTAADLALAKTIQMSALPSGDGAFMGHLEFAFDAESVPAREVGGDFYDFYAVPGGRIVFLVADVSGKGIPGALFMMEAKNVLKNCLTEFADIAEAVTEANRRICESNRAELFVTAWVGALDPKSGTIEFVNAGHNRPFVRRADGAVEKVMGKGGRFLGMFDDASYRANALRLEKGDCLYLYTDGVTEAMNAQGEQFGEGRLVASFTGYNANIRKMLCDFVGAAEQSDDITGLLIRWNGVPECVERSFSASVESLGPALDFIRNALAGLQPKTIASVLNASDEIMSNIVNYSDALEFAVAVERGHDRLRLRFSDGGKPYNPLSHVDPDTHAAIEDRPIGGLGLVVVKRLADRVTYVRESGRNVLAIIKRIPAAIDG